MHLRRIRTLSALALGLTLLCAVADAQLLLTGYTTGSFTNLVAPHTQIQNSADGTWANFRTGIAASGSTQSKIEFQNVDFVNVASGQPIQIGVFKITNGMTLIGSGAHNAEFNVGLNLTGPSARTIAVSTVRFNIDHTPNLPNAIPDTFSVTFAQPGPVLIKNNLVQFHFAVEPLMFQVDENATIRKGDITVTFTPVPEPGTYALGGAVLLMGVVGYRRWNADRASSRSMVPA